MNRKILMIVNSILIMTNKLIKMIVKIVARQRMRYSDSK